MKYFQSLVRIERYWWTWQWVMLVNQLTSPGSTSTSAESSPSLVARMMSRIFSVISWMKSASTATSATPSSRGLRCCSSSWSPCTVRRCRVTWCSPPTSAPPATTSWSRTWPSPSSSAWSGGRRSASEDLSDQRWVFLSTNQNSVPTSLDQSQLSINFPRPITAQYQFLLTNHSVSWW